MMRLSLPILVAWVCLHLLLPGTNPPNPQTQAGVITVLDKNNAPVSILTDGDNSKLRIKLPTRVSDPLQVSFGLDQDFTPVAACTIAANSDSCETLPFDALGWHWDKNGHRQTERSIFARSAAEGESLAAGATVQVVSRPVVMVHGFGSSYIAWTHYLGPGGYLAAMGLEGFAVGDGQEPGVLNTGNLENPGSKTNTIAENAAILGQYIANVKKATHAQQVDLIAHSMGGLISRYYIDRVMQTRDVAQLIMLGSPNNGTDCANLPASLGFYLPATLEIRPSYVQDIFNPQITHRHGVNFYVLAGTPLSEAIQSPCTAVPSDIVISLRSATAIQATGRQLPVLHNDLNNSAEVFNTFVRPILQKPAGTFTDEPDPPQAQEDTPALQFTRIFTGHVDVGTSQTRTILIDNASVASFGLFDPTRSLTVTVHGATGNLITLDPVKNGFRVIDDPDTLVYIGYGFNNPKPGPWRVTLQSTAKTPPTGADYAISARIVGDISLKTGASALLPQLNEPVTLETYLELAGQPLPIQAANAFIRAPDGKIISLPFIISSDGARAVWTPPSSGLYAVDIAVEVATPDGVALERGAFLSIEVQPPVDQTRPLLILGGIVAGLLLVVVLAGRLVLKLRGR